MSQSLWDEIEKFDLDYPISEYGFSTRLAKENLWTINFTAKAITEYKKFMYLAATSERMVSPSAIVDVVWHQHLIFTQSYDAFCGILGKQVHHIPSTHNKNEHEKFMQAKENTREQYNKTFGPQPPEIWEYEDMYGPLGINISTKVLGLVVLPVIGLLVVLLWPLSVFLRPVYAGINNPQFLIGYAFVILIAIAILDNVNQKWFRKIVETWDKSVFVFQLAPMELVYLETNKLQEVIHGYVNYLVADGRIMIVSLNKLQKRIGAEIYSVADQAILDTLESHGSMFYPALLKELMQKPVFKNTLTTMEEFKRHFRKSRFYQRQFLVNFIILSCLLLIGLLRLIIGIQRERPIVYISIFMGLCIIGFFLYLRRLANLIGTQSLPKYYEETLIPGNEGYDNWDWKYFIHGNAILVASFVPLIEYANQEHSGTSGGGCSSCGSGDGGSSCGGCGGCGGD